MNTRFFKSSRATRAVLVAGAAVLLLIWSMSSKHQIEPSTAPTPHVETGQTPARVVPGQLTTQTPATPSTQASIELTSQELSDLQAAVADHPQRDQELARLVDYARFHKQTEQWRSLHDGPLTPQRVELARALLEAVPAHYSRGELMGPQAYLMAQALVRDIEPNPKLQATRLAQETARIEQATPADDQQEAKTKFDTFNTKKNALVAAHDALPPQQQNTQQLETAIETERRAILGSSSANKP